MSINKPCYPGYIRSLNGDTGLRGRKLTDNKDVELKLSKFFGKTPKFEICEDCDSPTPPTPSGDWSRPEGWLELPMPAAGSQEFYGLYPVWETSNNYVALYVDGTEDYQVDWGDGNVEIVTAGTKAQHAYSFNDLDSSSYYEERKYKQAIIHVTMINGGDMTEFSLNVIHDNDVSRDIPWMDINLIGSNIASLQISPDDEMWAGSLQRAGLYEMDSLTNADNLFTYALSLQKIEITGFQNVTSVEEMFAYCYSLQTVDLFDTSSVTSMYAMFYECYALQTVPLFNTSNVTDMSSIVEYCYSLKVFPPFDTSNVTDIKYMFDSANALYIPSYDTSQVTSGFYAFGNERAVYVDSLDCSLTDQTFNLYHGRAFYGFGNTKGFTIQPSCDFSKNHLVEIFNNLGTAVPGATINIQCYSGSELTPTDIAIATNKGFTVSIV